MSAAQAGQRIEGAVQIIRQHLVSNKHQDAENALIQLLSELAPFELHAAESSLRRLVGEFWPRRRRDLSRFLEDLLAGSVASDFAPGGDMTTLVDLRSRRPIVPVARLEERRQHPIVSPSELRQEWTRLFADLSDRRIFQWTTSYRTALDQILLQTSQALADGHDADLMADAIRGETAKHAREIYEKGFKHVTEVLRFPIDQAVSKSVGGLQAFLSVPFAIYRAQIGEVGDARRAMALRLACSSMLTGIILGYSEVSLGAKHGWFVMLEQPRVWMSYLGFIHADDVARLAKVLPDVNMPMRTGLEVTAIPVLGAVDELCDASGSEYCLPMVSDYNPWSGRLDISLQLPPESTGKRYLAIQCYRDGLRLDESSILEAIQMGVDLIAAPLTEKLHDWLKLKDPPYKQVINTRRVATDATEHQSNVQAQARGILRDLIVENLGAYHGKAPAIQNYPAEFPLDNVVKRRAFLVQRESIERFLRMFDTETGVRTWCSVRRSGKTTACRELASVSSSAILVNQTMLEQPSEAELNIFLGRVQQALQEKNQLPKDFVISAVKECAVAMGSLPTGSEGLVFVLDEYELLFGKLRAESQYDEIAKYRVVYPLLAQLADFAQGNLLILLGQQPDAHSILMDHNQLSPMVRQNLFPLFEHREGEEGSEFVKFLQQVVGNRLKFGLKFAEAVYRETSGHPYLTVNMMVDFFDWLIQRRKKATTALTTDNFGQFRKDQLTAEALERSTRYQFMQRVISSSLTPAVRQKQPWLHTVIVSIQRIAREAPNTLRIPEPQFRDLVRDVCESLGFSPALLLSTAQMANFLTFRDGQVGPTISLLGRLAIRAQPDPT